MAKSNERNPQVTQIDIGTIASATTIVVPGIFFRKRSRIKNVYLADQAGITKSNSNYQVVKLQDNASSPVAYATVATSDSAAVANTQLAAVLNVVASSLDDTDVNHLEKDVPAGTMLNVSCVGTGTAVLTKAKLIIEFYPA